MIGNSVQAVGAMVLSKDNKILVGGGNNLIAALVGVILAAHPRWPALARMCGLRIMLNWMSRSSQPPPLARSVGQVLRRAQRPRVTASPLARQRCQVLCPTERPESDGVRASSDALPGTMLN